MSKESDHRKGASKTVKKPTLFIGVVVIFVFAIFLGITAGAIGLGSIYPQLNSIAQPIACPGRTMTHSQQITEIGTAAYYTAKWFCVDDETGERTEVNGNTVALTAGPVYGLVIFAILLGIVHIYWYSSVGPAKNHGPDLW